MGTAISAMVAATVINETDAFEIAQSGVSKQITKAQLRKLLFSDPAFAVPAALPQTGDVVSYGVTDFLTGAVPRWRVIHVQAYIEAAVASSSTITFAGGSPTGIYLNASDYFAVGDPVRVVISGTTFYGICSAVTTALLTIMGPPLTTSTAITSLSVGTPDMVRQFPLIIAVPSYANATGDLTSGKFRWRGRTGYLVSFAGTHATTGQPKINVKCDGNLVSTADSNLGIQLSATAGTFVETAAATISRFNYAIADSQDVVIRVTAAVATQNYLSMSLLFVVP